MNVSSNKRSSGDRFIPRRAGGNFELSHYLLTASNNTSPLPAYQIPETRYVNVASMFYKKKLYRETLWSTLIPVSKNQKILKFSDPPEIKGNVSKTTVLNQHWPVNARKKPLIGPPLMILDMPDLTGDILHHITDWGSTGYLASVFANEIYLWHPKTNTPYILSITGRKVEHCVKWNREGTRIALSMKNSGIAIWDFARNKIIYKSTCSCVRNCMITVLDWCPFTKNVVSGCTSGRLCIWTTSLKLEKEIYPAHTGPIVQIIFSTFGNYLFTSGLDALARVYHWPMREHFEIELFTSARGIAFHPWRESLFSIGDVAGYLTLWNASTGKELAVTRMSSRINALTFNKYTAELVVSLSDSIEGTGKSTSSICVLSDIKTIVDGIEWHGGTVPYLLWSPDGTQLGTAGTDENLCVWEFLGASKRHKIQKRKSALFENLIR